MFAYRESHKYDDIIFLSYPEDVKRDRKSTIDRAGQFSPFAALTGYDAAVDETARLTETRIELDESEIAALNDKLCRYMAQAEPEAATITFFKQDERKSGGAYLTEVDRINKVDSYTSTIILQNGTSIPIRDIVAFEFQAK